MTVRPSMQSDLELIDKRDGGQFVYSMWKGYKEEESTNDFLIYLSRRGLKEIYVHTSGHANLATLRRMVEVIKPKKIIPIHTFEGNAYEDVFIGQNISRIDDGDVVEISPSNFSP